MIKSFVYRNHQITALAVAGALLACFIPAGVPAADKPSSVAKPEQTQAAGRLIIARSANMGLAVVGVAIDGKQTAVISYGRTYDAPLGAGPHTITVLPVPNRENAPAHHTEVNVRPGQTYKFTAKRSDTAVVLR